MFVCVMILPVSRAVCQFIYLTVYLSNNLIIYLSKYFEVSVLTINLRHYVCFARLNHLLPTVVWIRK